MADKLLEERLQPSLLDRLTDDEPSQIKEHRESRVIDVLRLREIIQRDLSWLLNTNNIVSMIDDPEAVPNVVNSVLNYGVSEVAGEFSTTERAERIRRSILVAIRQHEPRIVPGSADVELRAEEEAGEMTISFDIRADMWAQPVPMELYLRSHVDLTSGEVSLERSR